MKIQVLGSGCTTCKSLYELTIRAVSELTLNEEVEYITDITKIIEMGVMSSPVLAINGNPVLIGSTRDIEKIKDLITSNLKPNLGNCCEECDDDCECKKECDCGDDCECEEGKECNKTNPDCKCK